MLLLSVVRNLRIVKGIKIVSQACIFEIKSTHFVQMTEELVLNFKSLATVEPEYLLNS